MRLAIAKLVVFVFVIAADAAFSALSAQSIIDLLTTGSITAKTTGCFKAGGPPSRTTCTVKMFIRNDVLVMQGSGCSSLSVPVNGTMRAGGQTVTNTISDNSIVTRHVGDNGIAHVNTYTVSSDRTSCSAPTGCGSGWVSNHISCSIENGVVRSAARPSPELSKTSPLRQLSDPPNRGNSQQTSCSDITGTSSKSTAAKNCRSANSALTEARAVRGKNPTRAAQQYKRAADSYRRAGDTTQADSILREAAGHSVVVATAPSTPSQAPAASPSAAPPPSATAASRPRRMWSGETKDCEEDAGQLERNTAAWYTMCVPSDPAVLEKSRPNAYKPPISPQDLTARAIEHCKEVHWDEKRQCIFDFKLRVLLAEDPNVRAECSSKSGTDRIECIDAVFLYGPGANGRIAERENLRRKIASMPAYLTDRTPGSARPPVQSAPDSPCPPGQGVKPTPGAFGGWSCQALGLIWLAPNRPKPDAARSQSSDAPTGPDPVQAFEERVNHVAAAAVVAVADATGTQLSAAGRETCRVAAFAAVHSTLKGGAPPVPEQCRPMADAARMELAYYAGAHIDTMSNPGVEELLSSLSANNSNSGELSSGPAQRGAPSVDCTQAEAHWKAAEDLKLLAIYEDHLKRFATCNFAAVAAARIEQLRKR